MYLQKSIKITYPTVWHLDFAILLTWQKERKGWHICQTCSHLALRNWREVINAKPLEIASFHICHIFLRLSKLSHLPNQLCKTVGDACICRKIPCDGESCKVLDFWVYLNKALMIRA